MPLVRSHQLCADSVFDRVHDNAIKWKHFLCYFSLCEGNPPVPGGFPSQRPVTRSFDVFFDLHLNQRLSKQSRRWWFETPSRSLWRHCNGMSAIFAWYISFQSIMTLLSPSSLALSAWQQTVRTPRMDRQVWRRIGETRLVYPGVTSSWNHRNTR